MSSHLLGKKLVRMLAKPGRDKNYACNYRPISLLSGLGKIFERYVYSFLLAELESKNFITKCQAGFLKGRSSQGRMGENYLWLTWLPVSPPCKQFAIDLNFSLHYCSGNSEYKSSDEILQISQTKCWTIVRVPNNILFHNGFDRWFSRE